MILKRLCPKSLAVKRNNRHEDREIQKDAEGSETERGNSSFSLFPSFSFLNLYLRLSPCWMTKGKEKKRAMERARARGGEERSRTKKRAQSTERERERERERKKEAGGQKDKVNKRERREREREDKSRN